MSQALSSVVKLSNIVDASDPYWGGLRPGLTTDQSMALNNAIEYVKGAGGIVLLPPFPFRAKNIRMEGGVKPWGMRGHGAGITVLEHFDGAGNFFAGGAGSPVPYFIEDMTISGRYAATLSGSANNMIAIADTSGVRLRRLRITDFKEAGILMYDSSLTGGIYSDNLVEDCEIDGLGVANVGANIANMDRSGFLRTRAVGGNTAGSPGFGLQFKDTGYGCMMLDCYAYGWATAFANGGTGVASAVTMRGLKSRNCLAAVTGTFVRSTIEVDAEMNGAGQSAVGLTGASIGNRIVVAVNGLAAAKAAIRLESGCADNRGVVTHMAGYASGAKAVIYDDGALRNMTLLERTSNEPAAVTVPGLATFTTAANANGFEILGREGYEDVTIAGGVATIKNVLARTIRLDTEGAAASDDLDTLTHPAPEMGQRLTLRIVANARDVVLKHGTGNLALHGAADFTLSHSDDRMAVSYGAATTKWASNGPGGDNGT